MCGIFAVTSDKSEADPPDHAELADKLERLTRTDGDPALLDDIKRLCGLWTRPEGFLRLAGDPSIGTRLVKALATLESWMEGLEAKLESDLELSQKSREHIHRQLTAGKDVAWQLRADVLGNAPKITSLLGGAADTGRSTLRHGWSLNLILNNIDRLEVRGRDSAGIAAFVRFRSREDLDGFLSAGDRLDEFDRRRATPAFAHRCVIRPRGISQTLLFSFKIAEEVGEMGENVRFLRQEILNDVLFQAALRHPGTELQAMGHTRWASNGVISIPNCHPVDSAIIEAGSGPADPGLVVAALNGDIDNFQDLFRKYVSSRGADVAPGITTDAKIIPIVVREKLKTAGSLEKAFAQAFSEFEGSMAICLMAADRPEQFICAQKGSGQGLFIGFAGSTVAVASEMYGLVELTPRYVKAEGEKKEDGRTAGETFLVAGPERGGVRLLPAGVPVDEAAIKTAEITTRDINRGEFPHFFLKEISESVSSVEKTIRGKVFLDAKSGRARTLLDDTVLPPKLVSKLKAGEIRRIIPTGQGTAAVAAEGIGRLLEAKLRGARIRVSPMKATELSSHHLQDDMSDCLVVAVSQSGTTTDTNRTVDLARERGACVIGIVNRRNSDLVYKSDGVLYTSDGRDIEMSVASTKAFYAQNVAGQILSLALCEVMGLLDADERLRHVKALLALPAAMKRVLELSGRIGEIAADTVLKRRYWAVVGTGSTKVAADEIRIKLSELCYKAIAVDFLEDKKHIDLSSEPLILVCASGLPEAAKSDVAKEIAIFRAHASLPIVMADEDERRFDPYAEHLIPLPRYEGELSYLLPTMAGHLFGYHAARAFDRQADLLKRLRNGLVKELEGDEEELLGTDVWRLLGRSERVATGALELQRVMDSGSLNSGLEVGTATKLSSLLDFLLGHVPLDNLRPRFKRPGTIGGLLASLVEQLSVAVNELCRPIDAIKHQAKTVTVGVSRLVEAPSRGPLWSRLREAGVDPSNVLAGHANIVSCLEPLVARVTGATLYGVDGLSPIGKPLYGSRIRVERKLGAASEIPSRCDEPRRLSGTKWGVVADSRIFLGRGANDNRRILIVPVIGQETAGHLLLYHLDFVDKGPRERRMAALRSLRDRYKQILIAVTEATNREWAPEFIDKVNNEQLFLDDPRSLGALLR
ncbi:MAG: SIS domain-containing protein [Elusimicrobiota bacterium]